MIFALGVMLASLVGLLGLPLVFRLAQRRALAILERRMPVSAADIAAERDQLRASHAVTVRVLEQRIEVLDARRATTMADAGRQAGRLIALEEQTALDGEAVASAERALAEARRTADQAEAMAGAQAVALLDATALADRHRVDLETATARIVALESLLADQRVLLDDAAASRSAMPAYAARAAAVPAGSSGMTTDDMVQLRAANIRLRNEQDILLGSVAAATRERDRLRLQSDELLLRIDTLQDSVEDTSEQTALNRQLAVKQAKAIKALEKRIAGRDETIATLKRRLAAEQARAPDTGQLPLFDAGTPATASRDTEALRQAVAALAADIVRFASPAGRTPPPE